MSFTDAVSRISQIQQQIASLQAAFVPPTTTPPTSSPTSGRGATQGASMTFSSALQNAIGGPGATASSTPVAGLPTGANTMLTSAQQTFASRLATDTGLDPGVVSAWLLAEESGGAAVARQSANNNDWLNIGYTDGGTYGSSDSIWSDPTTAADATAGWLKGQNTIPGYGTASFGIQAILGSAGQAPAQQIAALQGSGWASSGYPSLPSLYQQISQ